LPNAFWFYQGGIRQIFFSEQVGVNMSVLKLEAVNLDYGNRKILENINWEINSDERWIVLGNNGSGKTTLASIICGYQRFSSGKIWYCDQLMNNENAESIRKEIGFVSSSYFNRCYIKENGINIVLGGYYGQLGERGDISDEIVQRALDFLKIFGMRKKGMYPYDLMSKGQQQKVLLCRGFMRPYKFLILDEPCSGLDLISRGRLQSILRVIAQKKDRSMVYITHHADEILPFFSHALLLRDGKVFIQGEKNKVITSEILSEFFEEKIQCRYLSDGTVSFEMSAFDLQKKIIEEI
jgi:iron complex transport system ATP-binding protein